MPFLAAPESSTAMRAATTEPWPVMSEYVPDWSFMTPILMMPSEICAAAGPAAKIAATTTRTHVMRIYVAPCLLRLDTQVLVQLVHVGFELGVGDHVDDAAVFHHVVAIRHGGGEPEVLLDEQHGEPLVPEPPERDTDLLHDHRRETFRRLVEQ